MIARTLLSVLLLASLGAVPAAYASSITYGYTDTQFGGTSQIAYTLGLSGGGCPPDCTMTVTINVSGTPSPNTTPVYLGSLVFKFGGSTLMDLDAVGADTLPTPPAIPTGWGVVKDADVDNTATSNLKNGSVPNGGFVGFYNTNLTTNLVSLSTAGTFTFTFDAHGVDTSSDPSLHNEYYSLDGSTVNFVTFLSQTAGPVAVVPEPSSLILASTVLAGLAGTVAWRKRRRR